MKSEVVDSIAEIVADRYLYWTGPENDSGRVLVEEGDSRSAYKAVHKGQELSKLELASLDCGYIDGKIILPGQIVVAGEVTLSVAQMRELLTQKGVEFDPAAKKAELKELVDALPSDKEGEE